MPRVLLVGWREPSARALVDNGADVICLHAPKHATAVRECPWVHGSSVLDDITDTEEVLAAASQLTMRDDPFDVICSGLELSLVAAAVARDTLGTRGLSAATALRLRDKYTQKAVIRATGIPVADTTILELGDIPETMRFPAVVKPPAGCASVSTAVVRSPEELANRTSQRSRWLVESYVDGTEMQIDGVVRDGRLDVLTVSRYLANMVTVLDGRLMGSILVPEAAEPDLYRRAADLARDTLASLGHTDGVFLIEAFETDTGLHVGECAGRVSGGALDESMRLSTGVRIHDEWARAVLDLPSLARVDWAPRVCGYLQLSAPPGVIVRMPSADDLLARAEVDFAQLHIQPGETMIDSTFSSDWRAATVVVGGATVDEVRASMESLALWFAENTTVTATAPESRLS